MSKRISKLYRFFSNKKTLLLLAVIIVIGVLFVLGADSVLAKGNNSAPSGGITGKILLFFGWLVYWATRFVSTLLTYFLGFLAQAATWSKFVDVEAVKKGWVILRSLCNMFFILIILVIAFATILQRESYNLKKTLPKVIIMAILINFSKMICGVVIEAGQFLMLPFVAALSGGGMNNLTQLFGMNQMWEFVKNKESEGELGWQTVGGLLTAFIASLVALVVIITAVAVLVVRVVMLWIYIILSPLAFLMAAFPQGKGYASRWWQDFSKQVIVGPVLVFFIWLALTTAQHSAMALSHKQIDAAFGDEGIITKFLGGDVFQTYVITLTLLIGGLVMAQEIGGAGGKVAGKGMQRLQQGKQQLKRPVGWGAKGAWKGAKKGAKGVGRLGLASTTTLTGGVDRWLGQELRNRKGSGKHTDQMAKQGVFSYTTKSLARKPSQISSWVSKKLKINDTNKEKGREATRNEDSQGVFTERDGSQYQVNGKGQWQQLDETGSNWKKDKNGKNSYLRDEEGQIVERSSQIATAFQDALVSAQSRSKATFNKAQDDRVEAERKKMEESGMSERNLVDIMDNVSESKDKRMAAVIQTAIERGFQSNKEYKKAQEIVGSNDIVSDKLEQEVNKKQTHHAYDFGNEADKNKFTKKIDNGEIDPTKLNGEAYGDEDLVATLRNYYGDQWNKKAEEIYTRGGKKTQSNLSKSIKGVRDNQYDDETGEKTEDWNKMAQLHARLTGKIDESFTDEKDEFQVNSFKEHVNKANSQVLNKIKMDNLEKVIQDAEDKKGNEEAEKLEKSITQAFSYGNLKSMEKQGGNQELVSGLVDMTREHGRKKDVKYINADSQLNSYGKTSH